MHNKNKILLINHYAGAPAYGMRFRDYNIAQELIKEGFEVCIIAASFSHLRSTPVCKEELIENIYYKWIKVPKYKNYGFLRFLNMLMFPINTIFGNYTLPFYPDYVIASSPSPFTIISGLYFKRKFSAKLIYEIRDIWPKSIIELKNKSSKHPLIKIIDKIDTWGIKNADIILSPLSNIEEYINEKGFNKKVAIIPNGITQIEIPLKDNTNNKSKFIVGYGGTLSDSNSIMNLIGAAKILLKDKTIKFKIAGTGERLQDIKEIIKSEQLSNIELLGHLPQKEFYKAMAGCNILYKGNPKKELYKYGVSSIKMVEYLLLKKPILDASFGVDIIENSGAGLSVEPENSTELAKGILRLKNMEPEKLRKMGEDGFKYVKENYLYRNTIKNLVNKLNA